MRGKILERDTGITQTSTQWMVRCLLLLPLSPTFFSQCWKPDLRQDDVFRGLQLGQEIRSKLTLMTSVSKSLPLPTHQDSSHPFRKLLTWKIEIKSSNRSCLEVQILQQQQQKSWKQTITDKRWYWIYKTKTGCCKKIKKIKTKSSWKLKIWKLYTRIGR